MRNENVTRIDILLMLLLASGNGNGENKPIIGKTRLQKELFLSQKALKDYKISGPYSFRPYLYGPYCKDIYNDIDRLMQRGLVLEERIETQQSGIIRRFSLTERGVASTKDLVRQLNLMEQYGIIQQVKAYYNSMDVVELVELTHREYPEYVG